MGTKAPEFVILTDDHNIGYGEDDADVSVLYAKPISRKEGINPENPISVESYSDERDLQLAIMASLQPQSKGSSNSSRIGSSSSSTRGKTKRVIDLSQDYFNYHLDDDDDDVQVIASFSTTPRKKLFIGESSNSKATTNNPHDNVDNGDVDVTFMCDICVDEKPKATLFCIKGCTHSYCSECMAKYIASKLQDNITSIHCPVSGCNGRLEPEYCRSILPVQVFDRWGDALCEALLLASEKFYCPYKDCSSLLVDDRRGSDEAITHSECPECRRLFCAKCRVPWHSDISCDEFQKLNKDEREREDILLMKLANSKKWKRCPKCKMYVERISGCLFMRCRCNYTFCYNCGAQMGTNHYCANCKH